MIYFQCYSNLLQNQKKKHIVQENSTWLTYKSHSNKACNVSKTSFVGNNDRIMLCVDIKFWRGKVTEKKEEVIM